MHHGVGGRQGSNSPGQNAGDGGQALRPESRERGPEEMSENSKGGTTMEKTAGTEPEQGAGFLTPTPCPLCGNPKSEKRHRVRPADGRGKWKELSEWAAAVRENNASVAGEGRKK